jgi:hypothetical protein
MSAAVSVGDFVRVGFTYDNTAAATSGVVADQLGNTYVKKMTVVAPGDTQNVEYWACVVTHAGTPTITCQFNPTPGTTTSPAGVTFNAASYTGSDASSTIDGVGAGQDNPAPVSLSTDAIVTGTFATATDGDLLDCICMSSSVNAGTGFRFGQAVTGGDLGMADEWKVQSTHSASTQATWTATSTTEKLPIVFAITPAGTGRLRVAPVVIGVSAPPDPFQGATMVLRPAQPGNAAAGPLPSPVTALFLSEPPDPFPGGVLVVRPAQRGNAPPAPAFPFHGIVTVLAEPPGPFGGATRFVRPPGPYGITPVDTPRGPKVIIYTSAPSGLTITTPGPSSLNIASAASSLNVTSRPSSVNVTSGDP